MTMRFRVSRMMLEIDGRKIHAIGFDSEEALDAHLADRGSILIGGASTAPSSPAALAEPAGPGRRSWQPAIEEAVESLEIGDYAGCKTASDVARRVLARIATMKGGSPSERTVRNGLGAMAGEILGRLQPGGNNDGNNSSRVTTTARGDE